MVQLSSYNFKNFIMESLYKLKHSELKFRQIVIPHDTTKAEREECKILVDEVRALATDDTLGNIYTECGVQQGT